MKNKPICHSRAGGNPAPSVCEAYESHDALTRFWIPAFAGMTTVIVGE